MSQHFKPEELQTFIDLDDRHINPFFVGRDDVMNDIMRVAYSIATHDPQESDDWPAKGRMQLIQGAPGIGKTSLLDALSKRCLERIGDNDNSPFVMPVMIADAKALSPTYVGRRLRETVAAIDRRQPNASMRRFVRGLVKIAASIESIGLEGFRVGFRAPAPETTTGSTLPLNMAVLLMIDEIQTVPSGPDGMAAQVLQHLEAGSNGVPILPVLAGLANSGQVLERLGLSRIGGRASRRLATLKQDDVHQAVQRFIHHFGITATADDGDIWARTLYRWSKGWPKHLQNGMVVLGEALLTADGLLSKVDVMAAQRQAVRLRHVYYLTRLGEHQGVPALIGLLMARLGRDPVSESHVRNAIHLVMQKEEWNGMAAPEFEAMLRRGLIDEIITPHSKVLYECPIPSLRSFVTAQTGTPLHDIAMGGDTDDVESWFQDHDVDSRDGWGRTPLHLAAQGNWPAMIDELLAHGATLEAGDQWQCTPLHLAASDNAEDSLACLLKAGALVHTIDSACPKSNIF